MLPNPGQAEVENLQGSVLRDADVAGFQIAARQSGAGGGYEDVQQGTEPDRYLKNRRQLCFGDELISISDPFSSKIGLRPREKRTYVFADSFRRPSQNLHRAHVVEQNVVLQYIRPGKAGRAVAKRIRR